MTLRGLAAGVARWFGREPVLDFVDWAEFDRRVGPEHAEATREHTFRSITASIARAREVLGYAPRYSSLDALREALTWLVAHGQVDVGGQQFPASGLAPPGPPVTPPRRARTGPDDERPVPRGGTGLFACLPSIAVRGGSGPQSGRQNVTLPVKRLRS